MDIQRTQATPPSQLEAIHSLQGKVTALIDKAKSGDVGQVDMKTLDAWLDQAAAEVFGGKATADSFKGVRFEAMNTKSFDPAQVVKKLTTVSQQLVSLENTIANSKSGGAFRVTTDELQNWLDDALLETIAVPGFEGKTQTTGANWIDEADVIQLGPDPGDEIMRVIPSKVEGINLPVGAEMTLMATDTGTFLTTSMGDKFFVPPGRDLPEFKRDGDPYQPTVVDAPPTGASAGVKQAAAGAKQDAAPSGGSVPGAMGAPAQPSPIPSATREGHVDHEHIRNRPKTAVSGDAKSD